jgi:octaprenyl-diphosphate synthase
VETVLRERNYDKVPFATILEIVTKYRGVERAMERASMFTERSRVLIHQFPDSPFQRALVSVTDLVTTRDH